MMMAQRVTGHNSGSCVQSCDTTLSRTSVFCCPNRIETECVRWSCGWLCGDFVGSNAKYDIAGSVGLVF